MYENDKQLLENDVLVMYILSKFDVHISEKSLTELVMTPGLVNYFSFQNSLAKLLENKFIDVFFDNDGLSLYGLTDAGRVALGSLGTALSVALKSSYDRVLLNETEKIRNETNVNAYHFIDINGNNAVRFYIRENGNKIVDIKFPVPDKETALEMCAKWKSNAYDMLDKIICSF